MRMSDDPIDELNPETPEAGVVPKMVGRYEIELTFPGGSRTYYCSDHYPTGWQDGRISFTNTLTGKETVVIVGGGTVIMTKSKL